jgi:lipopolysaccharide export system permease protein
VNRAALQPDIFTRYMMKRFAQPFFYGLALFAILIFLGDTFDKMNNIVKSKAPIWVILECLWLSVPYWAVRVIPMATLLATLVAMSGFVHSGEWLATQSVGIETKRFWTPLLWCAALVSVVAFAAQETVSPWALAHSRRLWRERVHPEWEWTKYQNVALIGGPDQFVEAWLFLPKDGRLERPTLETFGQRGVASQLDAKTAQWSSSAGRWIFHDGVERVFGPQGVTEKPFKTVYSDLRTPPLDLVPRTTNPDELTLREVREQARRAGRFGGSPRELEVALHAKLAYPLTSLILAALGIPIALRLRRTSMVVSFCAALGLSFLYLWFIEVGRALGVSGRFPPVVAAWLANVSFAGLAAVLLKRWDL